MRINRSLSIASGQLPLRLVLVASFVLQMSAAVGLTTWLSFRNSQRSVNYLAAELSEETTGRIEEHLESYLLIANLLQRNSRSLIRGGDLDVTSLDRLERHFWHQMQAVEGISSIYFATPEGEFVGVQRRDDGQYVQWRMEAEEVPQRVTYRLNDEGRRVDAIATQPYDPRQRPWYRQAVAARRPIWSPIYRFASQDYARLGITPAVPLFDSDERLVGVLAIDLTLAQLSQFLRNTDHPSPSGRSFVIERDGAIVASSAEEPPFTLEDTQPVRLQATDSQDPLIQATARHLDATFGSNLNAVRSQQSLQFDFEGQPLLVQVMPFLDERGLDWLVVNVVPAGDFMGPAVAQTRTTLMLCLLSLTLATLIAFATARWVVSPITRLNRAAQQLAVGQWHQPLPEGRFQEVSELAGAFQRMATQLQRSFETLEQHNAELQRFDRQKDDFLANTSHELKTPLNGMIGLAESLLDGAAGPLPRRVRANLSMIVASGQRLTTLVNDLLDFSRLRHSQLELRLASVGLREATDIVLTLNRPLARQRNLQLINAVSPQLPLVLADEDRLQQILHNLVNNAVKFTPSGMIGISAQIVRRGSQNLERQMQLIGSINGPHHSLTTFSAAGYEPVAEASEEDLARADAYLAITVSDTGIGIAADQLERIFYPFEQGDGSTARLYGGMGIGLAVTRQLVELHGGVIWGTSTLGVGSQFTFTLPLATAAAVKGSLSAPPALATQVDEVPSLTAIGNRPGQENHRFQALVVDDDPINRQVILNHLTVQSYQVTAAVDGPSALRLMEEGLCPDVVLLDVMMPGMTGYEVCRILRETYPANELPIIMLTAKSQVADLVEGLAAGANDYITKPVKKNELLARMKTHLHLSKINLAYSRFVPREFLQFLHKDSIVDVELGDQVEQSMSVMFADILDFTSLSERMPPEENFKFLNAFLSRMEPAIAAHHGFIDKYIGDAIMALFSGEADDALQAAIDMLRRLDLYNQERGARHSPISIGIGINTGPTMLGTVGGKNRMDSTVISDTVNIAARIERLTRLYRVSLLISHNTFLQLQDANKYGVRVIDRLQVKGKTEYTSVYEVFDADSIEQQAAKMATKTTFETAILSFYCGNYDEAAHGFQNCLEVNPQDQAAQVYWERCQRLVIDQTA